MQEWILAVVPTSSARISSFLFSVSIPSFPAKITLRAPRHQESSLEKSQLCKFRKSWRMSLRAEGRSLGVHRVHFSTKSLRWGSASAGTGGVSSQLAMCIIAASSEGNLPQGGWAVTISITVQPNPQMSTEKSYSKQLITSGAIQRMDPRNVCLAQTSDFFEHPKSASFTHCLSWVKRTLAAFMSRCMMECR